MDLLWTDFLNSEWHDWRGSGRSEDRLDNPSWIERFLAHRHLTAPVPPSPAELEALKAFRGRLRLMAESLVAGGAPGPADLALLNHTMAHGPVTRQITPTLQIDLAPVSPTWQQVMAEVAGSFAATLAAGDAGRIRFCDNPDCRWVFCDDTRNRTKRFCDDKMCGNLVKVRRFRARRREAQPEGEGEA